MANAKHKVTGIVVELTEGQLKNPFYAENFDVVEGDAVCIPCGDSATDVVVEDEETEDEEEWQE